MIKCPLETSIVNQHTLIQKILKMIRMAVQKRTKDVKLSKNVGGYELWINLSQFCCSELLGYGSFS